MAEGMMHSTPTNLLPRLVSSGVVPPSEREHLRAVLIGIARLRDSVLPWIAIGAALISFFWLSVPKELPHEVLWVGTEAAGAQAGSAGQDGTGMGFGAWWYLYVGRTIFLALLLAWFWRLVLLLIVDAPILDAPELGPIADTAAPYELIAKIRPLPLTMGSLVPLVGAAVLPMIILVALELPLKTIFLTAMKILV